MNRDDSPDAAMGAVLFTDLVGFTEYNDVVGDVVALAALDMQTDMATTAVASRDGARIVKELGDGLMLWFDTARVGVAVATELLETLRSARSSGAFPLSVRMGMHHGPAVNRGDDVVGQTVNIAARVSDLAGPGELLVSEAVIDACAGSIDDVDLDPVGPVSVKGVSEPIWLQRVAPWPNPEPQGQRTVKTLPDRGR